MSFLRNPTLLTWVGRLIGFGLSPLALLGLTYPVYSRLPEPYLTPLGWFFLCVATPLFLGNCFLFWRRAVEGNGPSVYPFFFLMSAAPAFFLLLRPHWLVGVAGFLVLAALDVFGPWLVASLFLRRNAQSP